jgi:hypothetical protein
MKQKTKQEIQTQIERLNGMLGDKMTPDLIDWMKRRIHILKQMTKDEADAKEL